MGALAAKYRPDGFLFYYLTFWPKTVPIRSGPYTEWNPRSWRTSHGDGSWVCMREGRLPVPTIRLENYRDGLEDYAYVRILEETVRSKEERSDLTELDRQWLARARAALEIPKELVASLTEYSRDPTVLYAWREKLADLIEESGGGPIDPWKDGFGLSGPRGAGPRAVNDKEKG